MCLYFFMSTHISHDIPTIWDVQKNIVSHLGSKPQASAPVKTKGAKGSSVYKNAPNTPPMPPPTAPAFRHKTCRFRNNLGSPME